MFGLNEMLGAPWLQLRYEIKAFYKVNCILQVEQ